MHQPSWERTDFFFFFTKFIERSTVFGNSRGGDACIQSDGGSTHSPFQARHTAQLTWARGCKHVNPHTCPWAEDCWPSCSSSTPAEFSGSHPGELHGDRFSSFLGKIIFLENSEISFCWIESSVPSFNDWIGKSKCHSSISLVSNSLIEFFLNF